MDSIKAKNPFQKVSNPFAYNQKERWVRCLICKTEVLTAETNVKCQTCGSNMITVIKSNFENEIPPEKI